MRILIFNWKDLSHPDAGGAEVFTHEVARRLVRQGHDVTQFCSRFSGSPGTDERDGVRILRSGGRVGVYHAAKRYWRGQGCREGFDVVVDEVNTRPFLAGRFVRGPRVVLLIHQLAREVWMEETPFPLNLLGRYALEPLWLRRCRELRAITVSNSTAQDLKRLRFREITIVPEGLPPAPDRDPPPKEPSPTLIFVGRLVRTKRPGHALQAFARVRAQIPDARLWIVGSGYLEPELRRAAGEGVTFFGRVDESTKHDLMARAHGLLMPAVREGWGLVVIEANQAGTPAVGYDVPGVRDAIRQGESGLLVAPSPQALAEGAIALLQSDGSLTQGARAWSRSFTWDRTAAAFIAALARP